jgi:hypothetical protein
MLTEATLLGGTPSNFSVDNIEGTRSLDEAQQQLLHNHVQSALAEVDKLWPMSPTTTEPDVAPDPNCTAVAHPITTSAVCGANPPPANNAFQMYGAAPVRVLQHDDEGAVAAAGVQTRRESGKEGVKSLWIRPWDSVFDRKKNGFGTSFAKQVLELCHCDGATIARILSISMRHIAVKKSGMVVQRASCSMSPLPHPPQGFQEVVQGKLGCWKCSCFRFKTQP